MTAITLPRPPQRRRPGPRLPTPPAARDTGGRRPTTRAGPATTLGHRPAAGRLLGRHRASLYLWGLGASGWANSFYSAAVQAGTKSWKAFFFGSLGRRQLHHRRQAARRAVGDGALGSALRGQRVEHPRAPGARRRGRRRRALRRRCAAGSAPAPGSLAGAVLAADPGRGADVPLQQPRRPARAAPHRRRLRHGPGARSRAAPGGSSSPRPSSASASSPRCSRPSWSCPPSPWSTSSPGRPARPPDLASCCSPAPPWPSSGRWWVVAVVQPCRPPTARTSAARRTTASGTSSSATTASAASPATRPAASAEAAARRALGRRPGCPDVQRRLRGPGLVAAPGRVHPARRRPRPHLAGRPAPTGPGRA